MNFFFATSFAQVADMQSYEVLDHISKSNYSMTVCSLDQEQILVSAGTVHDPDMAPDNQVYSLITTSFNNGGLAPFEDVNIFKIPTWYKAHVVDITALGGGANKGKVAITLGTDEHSLNEQIIIYSVVDVNDPTHPILLETKFVSTPAGMYGIYPQFTVYLENEGALYTCGYAANSTGDFPAMKTPKESFVAKTWLDNSSAPFVSFIQTAQNTFVPPGGGPSNLHYDYDGLVKLRHLPDGRLIACGSVNGTWYPYFNTAPANNYQVNTSKAINLEVNPNTLGINQYGIYGFSTSTPAVGYENEYPESYTGVQSRDIVPDNLSTNTTDLINLLHHFHSYNNQLYRMKAGYAHISNANPLDISIFPSSPNTYIVTRPGGLNSDLFQLPYELHATGNYLHDVSLSSLTGANTLNALATVSECKVMSSNNSGFSMSGSGLHRFPNNTLYNNNANLSTVAPYNHRMPYWTNPRSYNIVPAPYNNLRGIMDHFRIGGETQPRAIATHTNGANDCNETQIGGIMTGINYVVDPNITPVVHTIQLDLNFMDLWAQNMDYNRFSCVTDNVYKQASNNGKVYHQLVSENAPVVRQIQNTLTWETATDIKQMKLFNMNGQLLSESKNSKQLSIPSNVSTGIYLLQMTDNSGYWVSKKIEIH